MTSGAWQLVLMAPIALTMLSFFSILPSSDPLSGAVSEGRVYTLGTQGAAMALALAISLLRRRWPPWVPPSVAILTLFGCLGLASALWSPAFDLTAAKSLQFLLLVVTAFLIGANLRGMGWRDTARLIGLACITVLAVLLTANVFLFGTVLPIVGGSGRERLLLAYAHPLTTGGLATIGTLALMNARMRPLARTAALVALATVLLLTNARNATAFVAAYLAYRVLVSLRPIPRMYAAAVLVVMMLTALLLFDGQLAVFVDEQMTHGDISTLNGRIPLWTYALESFGQRPIEGHGYYASRFILLPAFPWAGQAHSSFVEVLLTTGVLGFTLLVAFCVYLVSLCRRTREPLLTALALFALADSVMNPGLFDTGLVQFTLLIALTRTEFSLVDAQGSHANGRGSSHA